MSSKPGLMIYPESELKFRGPFDKVVLAYLRLSNYSDKLMLFKIKTTAPKKYCVRPNCGSVAPNDTVKVMIALQPFDFDPDEKNKHKFMVQSLVAHTETVEIEQAFHEAESDQVMETKLRCVFELPKENEVDESNNSGKDASVKSHSSPGKVAGSGDEVVTTTVGLGSAKSAGHNEREYTTGSWNTDAAAAAAQRGDPVQEDIVQLRQENLLLNEQIMRLKMTIESAQTGRDSAATKSFQNNPYAPPPQRMLMQQQQRTIYLVGAVFMVLFGMLVGKFVL